MSDQIKFWVLVLLYCFISVVDGVHVFDVYRMLQYDRVGIPFGCQRSTLNALAVTLSTLPNGDLIRYVVLLHADQLSLKIIDELLVNRSAEGLLILIPPRNESIKHNNINMEEWIKIEKVLVKKKLDKTIYFAYLDETTKILYDELSKEASLTAATSWLDVDSYRLEVLPPEAFPIKETKIYNIQGWLAGSSRTGSSESLPTIAIISSYDSFGIAPGLATGVDSNGSGVVALLELARLYSRLYRSPKTQGEYNIVFLLTGAGRLNFAGTKYWLEKTVDQRLLDSIEFAICLDTIGSGDGVKLHVSRSEKDTKAKQIYEAFSITANLMNINFEVVHKKINISSEEVPWQHEQFSRKKILAGSISNIEKPMEYLSRSNIFDKQVEFDVLIRNIKFIGEALGRVIYSLEKSKILVFSDELDLSQEYISSWINTLSKYPRVVPYLVSNQKGKEDHIIVSGLEKELSKYTTDVSKTHAIITKEYNEEIIFYDKITTQMSAYRGKPVIFDLVLSFFILTYLALLYTYLKGPKETIYQIKQIFTTKKKGKK